MFIPSAGGAFNANNGSGGIDVGAFAATIAAAAPLVWSNQAAITAVNRSNGLTVNWTGGSPNSYVRITGTSFAAGGGFPPLGASFTCSAPISAGQFTVPASVLSALPPTGTGLGAFGSLSVGNFTIGPRFTAPGLDAGFMTSAVNYNASVTYQ